MTDIPFLNMMAAAVAAHRINGRYIKRYEAQDGEWSNNVVVKFLIKPSATMDEDTPSHYAIESIKDTDREEAEKIVQYLDHKMIELIAGQLQDYWKNLVLLTERKTISDTDYRTIALLASVPSSYYNAIKREKSNERMAELKDNSKHIGKVGDNFATQTVTILSAVYSATYGKYFYSALTADQNIVRFPNSEQYFVDDNIELSGRIYKHDENNTTRLHYVRVKKVLD